VPGTQDFVVTARVVAAPTDSDGLALALRQAGLAPPCRVIARSAATPSGVADLVERLAGLVASGLADELVVPVPSADAETMTVLLSDALAGRDELDVDLVVTEEIESLRTPNTFVLAAGKASPGDAVEVYYPNGADTTVPAAGGVKYDAELAFWRETLESWTAWYLGRPLGEHFQPPAPEQMVTEFDLRTNAAVTFSRLYQEVKYVTDLNLHPTALRGLRVLDVGCGPAANLLAFSDCERHGIDPLIDAYRTVGFPLDVWSSMGYAYHCAPAEAMPFPDGFFDAVVSVNAIDHIDDFAQGAAEVRRVLRPDGVFRMHVHYHEATTCEPLELNDDVFLAHYGWVPGLRKISVTDIKDSGLSRAASDESFVLWGNR
jgi:SAM-dependent methyltransferase